MGITIADVRPDPVLTPIAMLPGLGDTYVSDLLVPTRPVASDSYKYMKWNLRDFIAGQKFDSRRAPGARPNRVKGPKGTYTEGHIHERSFEDVLTDEIRHNAPNPAAQESAKARALRNLLKLDIEMAVRDIMTNTGTITSAVPGVKWDAASNVVIEKNIDAAKEAFIKQCGFAPNAMIVPPAVAQVMKRDSSIRELVKYTSPNLLVNGDLPPTVFNMRVVIPGAITDTANPGQAASIARVWSADKVVLAYYNPEAATNPEVMTAVMRFANTMSVGGVEADILVEMQRDPYENAHQTIFTGYTFDDIQIVADALYILDDVLT